MLINYNPDDYVPEVTHHTCDHHKREPWDKSWAGCTCSAGYGSRLATPKERAENVKRREEEQKRRELHMRDYDAGKLG